MIYKETDKTIWKWLNELGVNISYDYLQQRLNINEDYPSLRSISKTLTSLEIEHAAIKVERKDLPEVPLPFLARLTGNNSTYTMIRNTEQLKLQAESFFTQWTGILLVAEKPVSWYNSENEIYLKKEKIHKRYQLAFASVFLIISVLSVLNIFTYSSLALLLIAFFGIFISGLIIDQEKVERSIYSLKACSQSNNCSKVLSSSYSEFMHGVKWSDLSLIYFSTLLLFLVSSFLTANLVTVFTTLAMVNLLAIPTIIVSVYYQWQVIGSWCRLCLSIDALLMLQLFILTPYFFQEPWKSFSPLIFLLGSMLLTTVSFVWLKLRDLSIKSVDLNTEAISYHQLLNNTEVFETLLKTSPRIANTTWPGDIQLGEASADIQITLVINPMCAPCAKVYNILVAVTEKQSIGLTVRFKLNNTDSKDELTTIADHLLQQFETAVDRKGEQQILSNWFSYMDFKKYKSKYPLKMHENVRVLIEQNYNWVQEQGINSSPVIYINNHKLPKFYKPEQLNNVIDELLLKKKGMLTL